MKGIFTRLCSITERQRKGLISLLFAVMLVAGIIAAPQYGAHWDEATEDWIAKSSLIYVVEQITGQFQRPWLEDFIEKDHGQALYFPLAAAELAVGFFQGTGSGYVNVPLRHIYTFLLCFGGLICLYCLVRRLTGRRLTAALSVSLAWLTPRFFAEYHYNNKDMVAFAALLALFWFTWRFFEKESFPSAVLAAAVGALAVNARAALGLFLLLAVLYYTIWKIATKAFVLRTAGLIATAGGTAVAAYYFISPFMWLHPVAFLRYTLSQSTQFSIARWNGWILYRDELFNPEERPLPWHYLPTMIAITTPLLILGLSLFGFVRLIWDACRKENRTMLIPKGNLGFLLCIACFTLLSLALPIAMRSSVYNGWRHLYYAYAGVLLLAVWGMQRLLQNPKPLLRHAAAGALAAHLLWFAAWIGLNHPNQFAYYNLLAGTRAGERYELDYWCLSTADVMRQIMDQNGNGDVYVLWAGPASGSYPLMDMRHKEDRSRLRSLNVFKNAIPKDEGAAYYIFFNTSYERIARGAGRNWPIDASGTQATTLQPAVEVMVQGNALASAYRLTREQAAYLAAYKIAEAKINE